MAAGERIALAEQQLATPQLQAATKACVEAVAKNPRTPRLNTHPVRGTKGVWEAYVDWANRITFHYDEDRIVFRNNCIHSILDRNP